MRNTIFLAVCFLVLFGLGEWLYHKIKVKVELTRKLVHFGTGLLTLLFPLMLDNAWAVLFLCGSFAFILFFSLKYNLLKSINAIDRKSHGSISYPIAVFGCYCFYEWYAGWPLRNGDALLAFYLPVLTLAICDPIAALSGKRWPLGPYKIGSEKKTLMGSAMFVFSAFLLSFALLQCLGFLDDPIENCLAAAMLAIVSGLSEGLSRRGLDNFFIPFSVIVVLTACNLIL